MTAQPVAEADVLDALDWDHTPACEAQRVPCSDPATHAFVWVCGCIQLLCDNCTARWRDELAGRPEARWTCSMCFADYGWGSTLDFVEVRKI